MTPTNGDGSVPVNGSGPESALPPADGNGASPPPDFSSSETLGTRREGRVRMAVLKALQQRDKAGREPDTTLLGAMPPSRNGGFPANGNPANGSGTKKRENEIQRMLTRGQSLLPPSVRDRLKGDFLPQVAPSMMRRGQWKASWLQVVVRLYVYSSAAFLWALRTLWEKIRGTDSEESRAIRLRLKIEKIGGTAVKLGQQMAMRIDFLPYEYSVELSKMLDRMVPFPVEYTLNRIESFLGRPLEEVFKEFIPVPIGSASVACVFSAYLANGERVAIKVRRPQIGEKFVA